MSMYEDVANEARHAWLNERELEPVGIDFDEDTDAEDAYWAAEGAAELEAERRNEEALYGGGYEDDPQERELWAVDPQINGEYESMPQISIAEANREVAGMIAARDEDLPF